MLINPAAIGESLQKTDNPTNTYKIPHTPLRSVGEYANFPTNSREAQKEWARLLNGKPVKDENGKFLFESKRCAVIMLFLSGEIARRYFNPRDPEFDEAISRGVLNAIPNLRNFAEKFEKNPSSRLLYKYLSNAASVHRSRVAYGGRDSATHFFNKLNNGIFFREALRNEPQEIIVGAILGLYRGMKTDHFVGLHLACYSPQLIKKYLRKQGEKVTLAENMLENAMESGKFAHMFDRCLEDLHVWTSGKTISLHQQNGEGESYDLEGVNDGRGPQGRVASPSEVLGVMCRDNWWKIEENLTRYKSASFGENPSDAEARELCAEIDEYEKRAEAARSQNAVQSAISAIKHGGSVALSMQDRILAEVQRQREQNELITNKNGDRIVNRGTMQKNLGLGDRELSLIMGEIVLRKFAEGLEIFKDSENPKLDAKKYASEETGMPLYHVTEKLNKKLGKAQKSADC